MKLHDDNALISRRISITLTTRNVTNKDDAAAENNSFYQDFSSSTVEKIFAG